MLVLRRQVVNTILMRITLRSRQLVQSHNRRPGNHVSPGSYGVSNVGAGGWRFV